MAVTHYDLTATFTDLLGSAYSPTSAAVVAWIETNVGRTEGVVDSSSDVIGLGPQRQTADSTGLVTFANLIGSDSDEADINIADGTLQYRVTAEYINALTRKRGERWSSGWFSLTADVDLADVVAEQYIPATYISQATATLDAIRDEAQGFADAASDSADDAAASAAEAVAIVTADLDTANGVLINTPGTDTSDALNASIAQVTAWAKNPDTLITGAITRNVNGVVTSAVVKWPDGVAGVFTTDTIGALSTIDAYHVTRVGTPTKTYTQPTITRDAFGAATNVPAIVVS